jgi:ATP-dependent exoDNAse (exonuclease V) alpha subunit
MVELHTGAGGCGKTHYNLTDKGLVGVNFYAPTWKLARSKQKEYNCRATTIAKISTLDVNVFGSQYRYANVLVVDEVSMMDEETKQQILKNMKGCKIIFCGDIGYQLPPFDPNKPVKEFKKDIVEIKHKVNHRVECEKLATILSTCRKMMDEKKYIINYVLENCADVERSYNHLTDMILATTHTVKDEYTEKYKDKLKLVITKSDEAYGRGEVYYNIPNTEHYENRHGYTVHSIQGETMKGNIFIDMRGVYDNRMIYTMISRAKRLDQIVILNRDAVPNAEWFK